MKAPYIVLSCLAVLLTSACSKNDALSRKDDGVIRFMASSESETKTIPSVVENDLKNDGFYVMAAKTETMDQYFASGTTYRPAYLYYTTNDGNHYYPPYNLSFYAVYPLGQRDVDFKDGSYSFGYKVDDGQDLIAARSHNVAPTNESVPLTFKHILSGVTVNIRKYSDSDDCRLQLFKYSYNKGGTFTFYNTGHPDVGIWTEFSMVTYNDFTVVNVGATNTLLLERNAIPGIFRFGLSVDINGRETNKTFEVVIEPGVNMTLNLLIKGEGYPPISFESTVVPMSESTFEMPFGSLSN